MLRDCVEWCQSWYLQTSTIWSILVAVTQVCVVTWSIAAKSWERLLKWCKLRLKQRGICNQLYKTRGITYLGASAVLWVLAHTASARKSVESREHLCGLCVWGGKANAWSFGMRRRKGAQRPVFSLQGCLPTSGHWALDIMLLEQMDLVTLGKTCTDIEKGNVRIQVMVWDTWKTRSLFLDDKNKDWHIAFAWKKSVGVANCAFKWFGFLETSCLRKECYRVNALF